MAPSTGDTRRVVQVHVSRHRDVAVDFVPKGKKRPVPPDIAGRQSLRMQVTDSAGHLSRAGRPAAATTGSGAGCHNNRSIRVLPSVFGLTRSRSRNSATPSS